MTESQQLSDLSHNPSKPKSRLRRVVVPTQDSEGAQCVPAACLADCCLHFHWNTFDMKEVEGPAPVLVASGDDGFDGLTDAAVGLDSCIAQIIQSAQNVIVPKRREREAEPAFLDDFAGSKRVEHAALEQIVFGPLAGFRDGRRFAPCSFVFEQAFEHADGGMERRAPAFRALWRRFNRFAVPAAIFELLA